MKTAIYIKLLIPALLLLGCNRRPSSVDKVVADEIVGGGCDGCELMFHGIPANINKADTSAGWFEAGTKLVISGKVYHANGKTAPDIIIYYWQTDNNGYYSKTDEEQTIHGHLRGWVKTDRKGEYNIYTVRPASYPKSTMPAHVHFSIKEPNIANEYYIDDILFEDDQYLNSNESQPLPQRGGNGIAKVVTKNGIQYVERDIILGLNIPNYPVR